MVSRELLEILACPICKSDIRLEAKKDVLVCTNKKCAKTYKIEDGIPIMFV